MGPGQPLQPPMQLQGRRAHIGSYRTCAGYQRLELLKVSVNQVYEVLLLFDYPPYRLCQVANNGKTPFIIGTRSKLLLHQPGSHHHNLASNIETSLDI